MKWVLWIVACLVIGVWLGQAVRLAVSTADSGGWEPFRDIDGHHYCRVLVGDTSYIRCADGYETTS